MFVKFGLSDVNSGFEIVIGKCGIQDFVTMIFEKRRFQAARSRGPAVEEEEFHGCEAEECRGVREYFG
jgi:hypothetical protein